MKRSLIPSILFLFSLAAVFCFTSESAGQDRNRVKDKVITQFKITGNKAIDMGLIKDSIQTQFPSIKPWITRPKFDRDVLEDDIRTIMELHADHGYYDADVSSDIDDHSKKGEVKIKIRIDQGDPVILRSLNIVIKDGFFKQDARDPDLKEEIIRRISLRPGTVFSKIKLINSKDEMNKVLLDGGYPKFNLTPQVLVNRQRKWAEANFEISTGPKYKFGNVTISGNNTVADYLIKRELLYAAGDDYSLEKITDSRSNIFSLGYFKFIDIKQVYNEQELTVDTLISVEERKFGSIRVGAGFGSEDRLRGQLSVTQGNFMGGGRNVDFLAKASFITQLVQASMSQPYIAGRDSELIGFLSFERNDFPSYEGSFTTSSLSLEKRFIKDLRMRGSFDVIYSKITSQSTLTPIEQSRQNVFLTTLSGVINFNTTDDIFNPARGVNADAKVEMSFKGLGSEVNYVLSFVDIMMYKSVSEFVFAKRLAVGSLYSFGSTEDLDIPIFKRFFAGGSNSVRGYDFQKLSPLNSAGDPIGGNSLFLGNLEIRTPLYFDWLGGVIFLDYGNVHSESFDYPLDELQYAVGTGLRYNTLIGPLRLDVGYALNPEPEPESESDKLHVFFSVGHVF